jgi:3' exoribonuclease family, domain 1
VELVQTTCCISKLPCGDYLILTTEEIVTFAYCNHCATGCSTSEDAERELFLRRTLEQAVLLTHYPRMLISVIVQVLSDDGGVLSTAINGAAVALLNAGTSAYIRH